MEEPLLRIENLKVWFPIRRGALASLFKRQTGFVRAVDGISFAIGRGKILCLAGESGCGKTTTGRAILKLVKPTDGKIFFESRDIAPLGKKETHDFRKQMQIIFQDPYESLNPRLTVFESISEGLMVNRLAHGKSEERDRVKHALELAGLAPAEDFMNRFPHELSGGQRQRVVIAGAIVLEPKFIVADEPVSMLDVSIRAGIVKLIIELARQLDLAFLFITHDLSLARYVADRIAVMYLGKIVEIAPTEKMINEPLHPYVKALISVVPVPDPSLKRESIILTGETPNPANIPAGCRFHPRCPFVMEKCRTLEPDLLQSGAEHYVACHLVTG